MALGTVADVVPLDRNNRILVSKGLDSIRAGKMQPGVSALLSVAGKNAHRICANDLGYILGPASTLRVVWTASTKVLSV